MPENAIVMPFFAARHHRLVVWCGCSKRQRRYTGCRFRPQGLAMSSFAARCRLLACLLALVGFAGSSYGQSAEPYYKGKQIALILGYSPGGTYDIYARLAASMLPRYIPGHPAIVIRNMPGAGSITAGNYLYSQASRDGLTIGMISQASALKQALHDPAVNFDARQFNWLGRFTPAVEATVVWHTSPVKSLADATKRETVLAGTNVGGTPDVMPTLMNRLAGTKFKIIRGYPGTNGGTLAMERGEVEGAHTTVENLLFSKPEWLRQKLVSVLVQYAQKRHPALPDVPAMVEFGQTPEDKQILALFGSTAEVGRGLLTPPGVPADRLAILRSAFSAMVADPAFKDEMARRRMEFGPMSGEQVQALMDETLRLSPALVTRAIAMSRSSD
jgi:tripartite-type tricarboxylate transporter receptor subunit TctC